MKYIVIPFLALIFLFSYQNVQAQSKHQFDSVHVFYLGLYVNAITTINAFDLIESGDSLKITESNKTFELYKTLEKLIRTNEKYSLGTPLIDMNIYQVDIRFLFRFYAKNDILELGFANTGLMYKNNKVFLYDRDNLNMITRHLPEIIVSDRLCK